MHSPYASLTTVMLAFETNAATVDMLLTVIAIEDTPGDAHGHTSLTLTSVVMLTLPISVDAELVYVALAPGIATPARFIWKVRLAAAAAVTATLASNVTSYRPGLTIFILELPAENDIDAPVLILLILNGTTAAALTVVADTVDAFKELFW